MERKETANRLPLERPAADAAPASVEALVTDARAGLTPAQMVEQKLVSLLHNRPLALSRFQPTAVSRRNLS